MVQKAEIQQIQPLENGWMMDVVHKCYFNLIFNLLPTNLLEFNKLLLSTSLKTQKRQKTSLKIIFVYFSPHLTKLPFNKSAIQLCWEIISTMFALKTM